MSIAEFIGEDVVVYSGEEAEKFIKEKGLELPSQQKSESVDELKGMPASRGSYKGTVKVLGSAAEISKVKEGDVLVTIMTTPDFVPAMKKAGAIVTDEGGVTCHAAIVSRELGIPCVIGTRNATSVLKDGDIVEINADEGVVRKV
ncbi:PEP-utilizing enzyme [Nanoarchaeota archaeon]